MARPSKFVAMLAEDEAFLDRVLAVVKTYLTMRLLWWATGLFSLLFVPGMLGAVFSNRSLVDRGGPAMNFLGMPLIWGVIFLVGIAKAQFAHSRARLFPGFIKAHLAVTAGLVLVLFGVYPLVVSLAVGARPLGFIALALAIGGSAIWGAHLNRFAPMFVALVVFFSMMTPWGLAFWVVDAHHYISVHAFIACLGAVAVVAWLWRLCHLTEEMDDYQNVMHIWMSRKSTMDTVEQRRVVATQVRRNRLLSWLGDRWHARLGGYYGGSQAALVRLLRYGFSAIPPEAQALSILSAVAFVSVIMTQFNLLPSKVAVFGGLFFAVQFGVLMPGQLAGEVLAQRRPRVAYEMMLPVSRRRLIDGLFTATIRNAVMMWITVNLALGVLVAMSREHVTLYVAGVFILISAATVLAAIGVGLRVSVWQSMVKRLFFSMLAWAGLLPLIITWATGRARFGDLPFLVAAAVVAGVGVLLIRSARQAWMDMEFA